MSLICFVYCDGPFCEEKTATWPNCEGRKGLQYRATGWLFDDSQTRGVDWCSEECRENWMANRERDRKRAGC